MQGFLEKDYRKGFLLTEESIIKIHDIVKTRLNTKNFSSDILYKVFISDGMILDFNSTEFLTKVENSKSKKIIKIEIIHSSQECKIEISFSEKDDTRIRIESDRDFAYLLYSDIKEHIENEVLKLRVNFERKSEFLIMSLMPLMALALISIPEIFLSKSPLIDYKKIIASNDLAEKLNFLISQSELKNKSFPIFMSGWGKFILIPFVLVVFLPLYISNLINYFFPRNIFYWGRVKDGYDSKRKLRENLFWGVGVALVVGIVGSIIFKYMSEYRST